MYADLFLEDFSHSGKKRPWNERRKAAENLSVLFKKLSERYVRSDIERSEFMEKKQHALRHCSSFLSFDICSSFPKDHPKHLRLANFCNDRWCPMCSWRRSLRISMQNIEVFHWITNELKKRGGECVPLMVTFTVKNVPACDLQKTVDALTLGYKKMLRGWTLDRRVPKTREYAIFFRRRKSGKLGRFKCVPASNVLLGSIRSLEVTYNRKTRTFHPHIHALFFLGGEYFKFPYYITADEWRSRWRWAMNLDYTPQVRLGRDAAHDARVNDDDQIQELESDAELGLSANEKVVFEVSKYITDFGLSQRNDDAALDELDTLADVLHGRRILTFTGIARTARKALGLTETPEDEEVENEVQPSCNCTKCNSPTWRGLYLWSSQRGFYHLRSTDAEQIDHLELDFKTFLEYRRADIERITTSKLLHEALPQAAYFARLNELKKQEAS